MSNGLSGLRIALMTGSLAIGGAEKQAWYASRALRRAGADVHVLSLTRGEHYDSVLRQDGFTIKYVGDRTNPALRLVKLLRYLRELRPDAIQSCQTFTNLYAGLAGRLLGIASIGSVRTNVDRLERILGMWARPALALPSRLIVNSQGAADQLSRRGFDGRVFVVPNAIDFKDAADVRSISSRDDRHLTMLGIGRFVRAKRYDRWLEIFAGVLKREPHTRGVLVGDGPERDALEMKASELGLLHNLEFVGMQTDVNPFIQRADILFHSADEEGFPNVLLEAMAGGVTVVSTPAGEATKIIRNTETGFLVPFHDTRGTVELIIELLDDGPLRMSIGVRARRYVEESYGLKALEQNLVRLYRDVFGSLERRL